MSVTLITHRARYDAATDLVEIPAIADEVPFTVAITGTMLMDREGVAGLNGGQIVELVSKFRQDIGTTATILRQEGQVGPDNRIDILAFEAGVGDIVDIAQHSILPSSLK